MDPKEKQKKITGEIVLDEFSDLKRIGEEEAHKIGISPELISKVISAKASQEETDQLFRAMSKYPIDPSDLWIPYDDTNHGVRIMRSSESETSQRTFTRPIKTGSKERSPFYDYRDTAMSSLSPLKPEWIRELRVVNDFDPENPEVIYNNGHSMEQLTFFKGPVNFYWEDIMGIKHGIEMNTGDSNYITPFHKHSFTSRDPNQEALILAVTFGGEVRRARKELYNLGPDVAEKAAFDYRNQTRAESQLLQQHINNERMSSVNLRHILETRGVFVDLEKILSGESPMSDLQKKEIAYVLNIELSDLSMPRFHPEEEVIITKHNQNSGYDYPSSSNRAYRIFPLARTSKKPLMKAHNIHVNNEEIANSPDFQPSLHTWVYNYGDSRIDFKWQGLDDNRAYQDVLNPEDSTIILPFTQHSFANPSKGQAQLVAIGVPGTLNLLTQRELSYLTNVRRAASTNKKWFD